MSLSGFFSSCDLGTTPLTLYDDGARADTVHPAMAAAGVLEHSA